MDADAVVGGEPAVGVEHLRQHRLRHRVHADVLEGADLGVALHVGLSGEDENLERFGVKLGREGQRRDECEQQFHGLVFFGGGAFF